MPFPIEPEEPEMPWIVPDQPVPPLRATQANVDLGATPLKSGKFTLTDSRISATSTVLVDTAGVAYTSKGTMTDEIDLQGPIKWSPIPGTGSAVIYWSSQFWQYGNIKYNYLIAA
jgi:hypothetical protein